MSEKGKVPEGYESWLDYSLSPSRFANGAIIETEAQVRGRADLAALRERVADLELMLRAELADPGLFLPAEGGGWFFSPSLGESAMLEDDGTGLPRLPLTPEARRAMEGR